MTKGISDSSGGPNRRFVFQSAATLLGLPFVLTNARGGPQKSLGAAAKLSSSVMAFPSPKDSAICL
ncbi:hypothetical protein ACVWZK_008540 [Bradyrhizobium sp. GM0.4]